MRAGSRETLRSFAALALKDSRYLLTRAGVADANQEISKSIADEVARINKVQAPGCSNAGLETSIEPCMDVLSRAEAMKLK